MQQPPSGTKPVTPSRPSLTELHAMGKSLRGKCPRHSHADWNAPVNRPDPLRLLEQSNEGRIPELIPIRHGRMLRTPFTFYRGAALNMAADLARTPTTGIRVQACGDCHLLNFGAYATPERRLLFAINDLDDARLGAGGVCRQEHLPESRAAGRQWLLPHPSGERHLPWLGEGHARPSCLRPPAQGHEGWGANRIVQSGLYGRVCRALRMGAGAVARAIRRAGYLGKSDAFDTAIADFANAYADQSERDHALFKKAVRSGQVEVDMEEDRG